MAQDVECRRAPDWRPGPAGQGFGLRDRVRGGGSQRARSAEQAAPAKRAEDFIVTLIMQSVARSQALVLSNNKMTSSWSPASKSTVAYWQCGDGIS